MYELRCPNCGWTSQMAPEAMAQAIAEADRIKATHHVEHCPRCQWVIRVPVDIMRSAMGVEGPQAAVPAPAATGPVTPPRPPMMPKPASKAEVKKVAARKPAARKAAAKRKVAAKKATAKKTAAKKSAPRKPIARKKPAAGKTANRRSKRP